MVLLKIETSRFGEDTANCHRSSMRATGRVPSVRERCTWIDDHLPAQAKQPLLNNARPLQHRRRQHSWQPTEEINYLPSSLIQDHTRILAKWNELGRTSRGRGCERVLLDLVLNAVGVLAADGPRAADRVDVMG
jgi:hypothetical protein